MDDILNIEGVRLEELEPTTALNDESIFLVGSNKVCRIISLRSLRSAFAGDSDSPDKDNVYYTATYMDTKLGKVQEDLTNMRSDIANMKSEVNTSIQNLNNRFDTLSNTLTDKINTQINDAVVKLNNKITELSNNINTQITELTNNVNTKLQEMDNLKDSLVTKSTKISTLLPASGWTGDDGNPPFTITISVEGVTDSNNTDILLPGTASLEQVEAWCDAIIANGTQSDGSITLKGYGSIPSIDIPIEVIIRNDI